MNSKGSYSFQFGIILFLETTHIYMINLQLSAPKRNERNDLRLMYFVTCEWYAFIWKFRRYII